MVYLHGSGLVSYFYFSDSLRILLNLLLRVTVFRYLVYVFFMSLRLRHAHIFAISSPLGMGVT